MKILAFDTETSGLTDRSKELTDPAQPRILQIACILAEDGLPLESFSLLVKHEGTVILSPEAQAVNGITHEMMQEHGVPLREMIERCEDIASRAELCVAHNLTFDMTMWNRETHPLGMDETILRRLPRFCTMKRDERFSHLKLPKKLTELHKHLFGAAHEKAHDALADAMACMKVYYELMDMVAEPVSLKGIF